MAQSSMVMPSRQKKYAAFGALLKELREQAGFTQAALAERLDVHAITVTHWETGDSQPVPKNLKALADALAQPIEKLSSALESLTTPDTGVVENGTQHFRGGAVPTDEFARSLGLVFQKIDPQYRLDAWLDLGATMAKWIRKSQGHREARAEGD